MATSAVWLVYTLMFDYPVPTLQSPQFSNQTSCLIYLGTLDEQVVKAFRLVCSKEITRSSRSFSRDIRKSQVSRSAPSIVHRGKW